MSGPRIMRLAPGLAQLGLGLLLMLPVPAEAQEPAGGNTEAADEIEYRNDVSLFLGGSYADDETTFTFGFDYEYKFNRWIGAGALIDFEMGEPRETLAGPAVLVHPISRLSIALAPAINRRLGENEFAFRIGTSYKFELDRLSIGPEYNLDFLPDETVQAFGLSVGVGF